MCVCVCFMRARSNLSSCMHASMEGGEAAGLKFIAEFGASQSVLNILNTVVKVKCPFYRVFTTINTMGVATVSIMYYSCACCNLHVV